jgi:hypothetical protein
MRWDEPRVSLSTVRTQESRSELPVLQVRQRDQEAQGKKHYRVRGRGGAVLLSSSGPRSSWSSEPRPSTIG